MINKLNQGEMNMKNDETGNQKPLSENVVSRINEKKARHEGLTKGVITASLISFFLIVALGIVVYYLYKDEKANQLAMMESQRNSFTEQLTERDSLINEWVITFDEIEKDLNVIKEKENIISMESADREFSKDRKDQILKDIEYINTLLDQNKKKIASLNAQLKNSGGTIKSLQNKVAELEASMLQRENDIAELKTALVEKDFEIEQLNTRMADLQITIAENDEKLNNQTDEMNKAFLASGTYKALKAKGLVSKEGGFLGIGKKEALMEDFSDSLFAQIDITDTRTIPVNSKVVKLVTEHPTSSYELIRDDDNKIAYIEITDPEQFWKISKYAVVEIKN
jgi:ACT domain-containing protein